jgi:hypothetical protein
MRGKKSSQATKKRKNSLFSEMPPFACVVCQVSRVRKKEEKSIEVSSVMGGKKAAMPKPRLRFFASLKVTNPKENKREDAQKLKAL